MDETGYRSRIHCYRNLVVFHCQKHDENICVVYSMVYRIFMNPAEDAKFQEQSKEFAKELDALCLKYGVKLSIVNSPPQILVMPAQTNENPK